MHLLEKFLKERETLCITDPQPRERLRIPGPVREVHLIGPREEEAGCNTVRTREAQFLAIGCHVSETVVGN